MLRELKVALANQLLQVYFSIFIKKFSDNVQVNTGQDTIIFIGGEDGKGHLIN